MLEQKIRLSNLRKLIFGRGTDNRSKPSKGSTKSPSVKPEPEPEMHVNDADITSTEPPKSESPTTTNCAAGHGRLPHSAYTNTVEHTLTMPDLKSGDLCIEHCGGRLYRYEPGVMVRIKGQNVAAVHKYWIEKLRCATCGYLVQASIPDDVGKEKYDAVFKAILVLQKYYVAVPLFR